MDKSLEKSLLQWLKHKQPSCGIFLKLTILCGVLNSLALIGQAFCIASILDGVIMQELSAISLMPFFIGFVVLILMRSLLTIAKERVSFEAGKRVRKHVQQAVQAKFTRLGPVFLKGKPAGAWVSIALEQVENLQDYYAKYVPQMALAVCIPLLILLCVFPINWAAGMILLATAPLIPLFMVLVGMGAADASRKNVTALARLSGHFMDRLKGLSTIKLFNRGNAELAGIENASEDFRQKTMSVLKLAFLSSAVLEFFSAVSIAVLAVYFGFSYLGHLNFGHYDLGISLFSGMFILMLAPEFYQPLRDLGTHYHAKAQAIGAAEALVELLAFPEPAFNQNNTNVGLDTVSITATNLEVFSLTGQTLLGPISFTIEQGQHVALVGVSGAGKSSLLNALQGFLPYKGSLCINQHELSSLDLTYWRRHIAWLGQDPQLFHGSIRDNVALANPAMDDAQIILLLKRAHIEDILEQDGLDTQINDQSGGVSVGQAQRIALARALSQVASVYLLDEPTASLDADSEQKILASLDYATQGKTTLMVTHRIDQLADSQMLIVLEKGQIVQQGTVQELSHQVGVFQHMLKQPEALL